MPQKDLQAQRLAAEAASRVPTPASVIDTRYRLQPEDLAAGQLTVVVRTVTRQGIERSAPVVHFAGLAKPLVLDAANVAALTQITGSPLAADWPGQTLTLRVVREQGIPQIRVFAPDATPPATPAKAVRSAPMLSAASIRTVLILILVLAVALAAVYLVENAPLTLADLLGR